MQTNDAENVPTQQGVLETLKTSDSPAVSAAVGVGASPLSRAGAAQLVPRTVRGELKGQLNWVALGVDTDHSCVGIPAVEHLAFSGRLPAHTDHHLHRAPEQSAHLHACSTNDGADVISFVLSSTQLHLTATESLHCKNVATPQLASRVW